VTLTVAARGELQGGNSEMLTAPMIGGTDMAITELREPGALVQPGDVVVQFDTTEQDFRLQEADADLAEAQQQVIKAEADAQALDEESQYAIIAAQKSAGIAPSEADKVFDPFFTTKPAGTGLGLALTHKIIEDHGGSISFRSAPGLGTTFTVVLPMSAERPSGERDV